MQLPSPSASSSTSSSTSTSKKRSRSGKPTLVDAISSTLPSEPEDFELPSHWHCTRTKPKPRPLTSPSPKPSRIPSFRVLTKNKYPPHLRPHQLFPYDPAPPCVCSPGDGGGGGGGGCDDNCQNFQLMMECSPETCPCCDTIETSSRSEPLRNRYNVIKGNAHKSDDGDYRDRWCANTVIQRAQFPPVEVFKSATCGFGLRSPQTLFPSTIIAEYTGEVITDQECLRRMGKYKITDAFYFASLGKGLILDAGKMGSVARFANHHCVPNCALQKWSVNGEPRVVLITLDKVIPPDTELCYNYHYCDDGLELDDSQRQPCNCGASNCAGTIGGKVIDVLPTPVAKWIGKAKRLLLLLNRVTPSTVSPHPLCVYLATHIKNGADVIEVKGMNSNINKKCSIQQLKDHFDLVTDSESPLYDNEKGIVENDDHSDQNDKGSKYEGNHDDGDDEADEAREDREDIDDIENDEGEEEDDNRDIEDDDDIFSEEEMNVIQESLEFKALREVVENIQEWEKCYTNSAYTPFCSSSSPPHLCNREQLRKMLITFPFSGVRLPITDWVEKSIKGADVAEVGIDKVRADLANCTISSITSSVESTLSSVIPTMPSESVTEHPQCEQFGEPEIFVKNDVKLNVCASDVWKFDWDDFVVIIDQLTKALPVRCADGYQILASYQRCSEWSRHHLGVYVTPLVATDLDVKRRRKITNILLSQDRSLDGQIANLPSGYAALWKRIELLGVAYGIANISAHFVVIASHIEDRVTLYENRLHLKEKTGTTEKVENKEKNDSSNRVMLHCFCLMTEEDAEFVDMVMCDGCDEWYHRECCNCFQPKSFNSSSVSKSCRLQQFKKRKLGNFKSSKSREGDNEFKCPLCQLEKSEHVSFSRHFPQEWQSHCLSNYTALKNKLKVKPNQRVDPQSAEVQLVNSQLPSTCDTIDMSAGDQIPGRDTIPEYLVSLPDNSQSYEKISKSKASHKALSFSYFQKVVEAESVECPLRHTPVTDYLHAVLDHMFMWKRDVNVSLCGMYSLQNSSMATCSDECPAIDTVVKALSQLTYTRNNFKKSIQLYLDLRILCVCPREVNTLRGIMWAFPLQNLFCRSPTAAIEEIGCRVNRARESLGMIRICQDKIVTLADLKRYITQGKVILKSIGQSPDVPDLMLRNVLTSLCNLNCSIISTLNDAMVCNSVTGATSLKQKVSMLTNHHNFSIDVTAEYAYARLCNLAKMVAHIHPSMNELLSPENAMMENQTTNQLSQFVEIDTSLISNASKGTEALRLTGLDHTKVDCCTKHIDENAAYSKLKVETYCWCDGPTGGSMICCECCDVWFHTGCVGLFSKKSIKKLAAEPYYCIACTEMIYSRQYVYRWASKYLSDTK